MSLPLMDALAILHPTPQQTACLQACLLQGASLARVWPGPFAQPGALLDFLRANGREMRGHLPLLYRNLTSQGIELPRALEPYLRAAVVRAALRHQQSQACFQDALAALAEARVDATVVKGAALARTVYPEPFLRHCHDLDLWVEAAHVERAIAGLQAHGCVPRWHSRGTTCLVHPAGLPVLLHEHLLPAPANTLSDEALRERRQRVDEAAGSWLTLGAPDALSHVLGHATTRGRRPHANWVVDAHLLSARMAAVDWTILTDDLERAGVALPALSLLAWLTDMLGTRVPDAVRDRLERAARGASGPQLRAAIDGARLGRPGGLRALVRRAGWHSRWTIARWLLVPPFDYARPTRSDGSDDTPGSEAT
jgi:hypothetical protein